MKPTLFPITKSLVFASSLALAAGASAAEAQLLSEEDPRRTISGKYLENARTLRDQETGKPGALLGMHVSVVNQRQRDGSYVPRNPRWWMPNHEITVTLVPISEKGTVSQSSSRTFRVVNEEIGRAHV